MSEMSSIFAQLRNSRALNESVEEPTPTETPVETPVETPEEPTPTETPEEPTPTETPVETPEEPVEEEVSAVFCSECGALISGHMNESEVDECPCCGSEELVEKVVKVVRDGKVVKKKVRTGAKPRLSAAQKAALAKARKKAHSAGAEKKRAKSLKKGAKAGLHEEDEIECTECGYTGEYDDFALDKKGNLICPDCGATVTVNESVGTDNDDVESQGSEGKVDEGIDTSKEDIKALLESVNAPKFIYDALEEGKNAFVTGYLNLKLK